MLTMTFDRFNLEMLKKLENDIALNGLLNPIVIRSPYSDYQTNPNPDISTFNKDELSKVFTIFVGNNRVAAAKSLGYTHISAYHVKSNDDARMINKMTEMKEFVYYV